MIKFNNRILMMTTMLLTFSFMTKANAQTFISGESGGGESTITTTCEMPPSCESLGYNKTAEDCANKVTLKCPMDESKLYCADAKQNGVCSEGYSEIETSYGGYIDFNASRSLILSNVAPFSILYVTVVACQLSKEFGK